MNTNTQVSLIGAQTRTGFRKQGRRNAGFTLMEVLIVVAIIGGILAAIGIPSFTVHRKNARIDNTKIALHEFEQALGHFESSAGGSSYPLTVVSEAPGTSIASGTLATASASAFSNAARFEQVLMGTGLVRGYFRPPMGNQNFMPNGWTATTSDLTWNVTTKLYAITPDTATPPLDYSNVSRVICQISTTTTPSTALGSNFKLPENNLADMPANVCVVSAVIKGANASDAFELAKRYNETLLDSTGPGNAQNRGRVVFAAAVNGVTDVYVCLGWL